MIHIYNDRIVVNWDLGSSALPFRCLPGPFGEAYAGPCGIHNAPSPSHFTLYKERQGYVRADGQDVVHQLSLAWAAKFP